MRRAWVGGSGSLSGVLRVALSVALWGLAGCGGAAPATTAVDADGGGAAPDVARAVDSAASDTTESTDSAVADAAQPAADAAPEVTLPDTAGCTPQCSGKVCGPDGCGAVCGFCKSGELCAADGSACQAFCQKQCNGKVCGPDGCGGQCGSCDGGQSCGVDGKCYLDSCVGSCTAKNCGEDGCGKSCGTCGSGDFCDGGTCKASPCKGIDTQKGQCQGEILLGCSGSGASATKTAVDCAAKPGLTCGWDPAKSAYACIVKTCDSSCTTADGKKMVCGTNACGQACGTCPDGWKCNATSCDPLPGASCNASSFPAAGQCLGNVWVYCNTGKLVYVDCVQDAEMSGCGWNAAKQQFECQ
jgi:hypothetical protein